MTEAPDIPPLDESVLAPNQAVRAQEHAAHIATLLVIPLTLLLVAVLLTFYVFYTGTEVEGESMLPNLRPADRVLITKSYEFPVRGDVIVAHTVDDDGTSHEVIKRIVGVPGDTIEVRDDVAIVNGKPESYAEVIRMPGQGKTIPEFQLGPGQLYLLGDNRPVSLDSRFIGPVSLDEVRGEAVAIYGPIQRVGPVH